MQSAKNIIIGFAVSFIGSVPLGYLNVIGFELYGRYGIKVASAYLTGICVVELFVMYVTLVFAKKIASSRKFMKYSEIFSIFFMLALAVVFYWGSQSKAGFSEHFDYPPFVMGIALASFNFMQIPFWVGWNIYLINGKQIRVSGGYKYFYLLGAVIGTFLGMLALIVSLYHFASHIEFVSLYLLHYIIPLFFLSVGLFQSFRFYRKYRR